MYLYNLLTNWLAKAIAAQQKTVVLLINDVKPIASSDCFFKLQFKFLFHFYVQFLHIFLIKFFPPPKKFLLCG